MKKTIIVIYGPPGVGKLTIGRELSKKTKLKFFNGHKLANVVHSIFDFGTKEFVDTTNSLWLFLFEKIVESKAPGIIVSFVYGVQTLEGKKDEQFFKKIFTIAKRSGANTYFIKLTCSDTQLYKRVQNKSRKKLGKLTSAKLLKKIRQKYKVDQAIPFVKNTVIDTTRLTARQTADRIISKLGIYLS